MIYIYHVYWLINKYINKNIHVHTYINWYLHKINQSSGFAHVAIQPVVINIVVGAKLALIYAPAGNQERNLLWTHCVSMHYTCYTTSSSQVPAVWGWGRGSAESAKRQGWSTPVIGTAGPSKFGRTACLAWYACCSPTSWIFLYHDLCTGVYGLVPVEQTATDNNLWEDLCTTGHIADSKSSGWWETPNNCYPIYKQ